MKVTFKADHIKIGGPRESDGSYTITFRTGEQEQLPVAKLMVIPQQTELSISVDYAEKENQEN